MYSNLGSSEIGTCGLLGKSVVGSLLFKGDGRLYRFTSIPVLPLCMFDMNTKLKMLIDFDVAVCDGIKYASENSCVYKCSKMGWTESSMDVIRRIYSGLFRCVN